MRNPTLNVVLGSTASVIVQLYSETSEAPFTPVNLSNVYGNIFAAKARLVDDSLPAVSFSAVTCTDPTNGKLALDFLADTFPTVGTYYVQIKWVDSAGRTHIYPSDAKSLLIKVSPGLF